MSHTKGPWDVNTLAGRPNSEVFAGDVLLCDCRCTNVQMEIAEIEANAMLMASAPELLKALKDLLDSLGALGNPHELSGWMTKDESDKIFAAIARAEGRP